MATADSLRKEVKAYEEAAFSVANADWSANGTEIYAFDVDTTGLSHPTVRNQNIHDRPGAFHPDVLGLQSVDSTFAFSTYLTATGTNVAEAGTATAVMLQTIFRAAWGGMHLGDSDGFSGVGTAAAPEVDTIGDWVVGDWFFAFDTTAGIGEFYQVKALPGGNVITPDRTIFFTPAADDVLNAVIQVFLDTDAMFDHTDGEYKTMQYKVQGHHAEAVWEIRGCKPSIAIDPIVQNQPVSARVSHMVNQWDHETLSKTTLTGTPEGQSPVVTGSGSSTLFFFGDQGTHTSTVVVSFAPTIGVSWNPDDGPNGLEGRHSYVGNIGDIMLDLAVHFDDDYATDFAALTEKNALIQVSKTKTEAVGIVFPRLQIVTKPAEGDAGGRATSTFQMRALENDTAHSLTGQDKEKFLSPVSVLFVA